MTGRALHAGCGLIAGFVGAYDRVGYAQDGPGRDVPFNAGAPASGHNGIGVDAHARLQNAINDER